MTSSLTANRGFYSNQVESETRFQILIIMSQNYNINNHRILVDKMIGHKCLTEK